MKTNERKREWDPATLSNRDVVTELELDDEDGDERKKDSGGAAPRGAAARKKGSEEGDK